MRDMSEKTFRDYTHYSEYDDKVLDFILENETNPKILMAFLEQEDDFNRWIYEQGGKHLPAYNCTRAIAMRDLDTKDADYLAIYKKITECPDAEARRILAQNECLADMDILTILSKDESDEVVKELARSYYITLDLAKDIAERFSKDSDTLYALYDGVGSNYGETVQEEKKIMDFEKSLFDKAMEMDDYVLASEIATGCRHCFNYDLTETFIQKIEEMSLSGEMSAKDASENLASIENDIDRFLRDNIQKSYPNRFRSLENDKIVEYFPKTVQFKTFEERLTDIDKKCEQMRNEIDSREENDSKDEI